MATVAEGEELRAALPDARVLVMSPLGADEETRAREARLEVALSAPPVPEGLDVHFKVDTGMGRWGMSLEDALALPRDRLVGVMSHLATADESDETFAREQIAAVRRGQRSRSRGSRPTSRTAPEPCASPRRASTPFAAASRSTGSRLSATIRRATGSSRCCPGGATSPSRGRSRRARAPGYGRRFVAEAPTRIGIVPVGYADGFRRGLTGTEVLVGEERRRVVGTISMDSFAVELGDEPVGTPVTLIGDGILAEEHARVLGTINYEITCGIARDPRRAVRRVVDG